MTFAAETGGRKGSEEEVGSQGAETSALDGVQMQGVVWKSVVGSVTQFLPVAQELVGFVFECEAAF
jgi:hypothetical protein